MVASTASCSEWLRQAGITEEALTPEQRGVLQAAFHFRQQQGSDYYSTRLLSHFLLHAQTGLKVAPIARLLGLSRSTASRQQGLSTKEVVQQAHHRLDGRPYGKLLPRYAGPIAEFLLSRPQASRADLLDFIEQAFGVRVSRIALFRFLKKFGLDQASRQAATAAAQTAARPTRQEPAAGSALPPGSVPAQTVARPTRQEPSAGAAPAVPAASAAPASDASNEPAGEPLPVLNLPPPTGPSLPGPPVPAPAPPFSLHTPSTPVPFC